jgi:hypothetical protein
MLSTQYLSKELYEGQRTLAVKSATGTGKTTSVGAFLTEHGSERLRILSIVSRMCLADAHVEAFEKQGIDAQSYTCVPAGCDAPPAFVVQLDSICKYDYPLLDRTVVYLDEFASLVNYLVMSDTLISRRRAVWGMLERVLKHAKQVIATDADLNDDALYFLSKMRPDMRFVHNTFENNAGVEAFLHDDLQSIIATAKKAVAAQQPFVFCFDSKTNAAAAHKACLDPDQPAERFLLHTAEDNPDIRNVQERWAGKYVFYSPKVVYGIDFVPDAPQPVFIYAKGTTISPLNIAQQMARTRRIASVHYAFEHRTSSPQFTGVDCVKAHFKAHLGSHIDTFAQMGALADDEGLRDDNLFADLFYRAINTKDIFDCDPLRHFQTILRAKGFVLNVAQAVARADWVRIKELREEVKKDRIAKYMQVVDGVCEDAALARMVVDRWDMACVDSREDKVKFAAIFADSEGLAHHFSVCKVLKTIDQQAREAEQAVSNEFGVRLLADETGVVRTLRWMEGKMGIKPVLLDHSMCAARRDEALPMTAPQHGNVMKTFGIRSKVTPPAFWGDWVELYVKGVKRVSSDLIVCDTKQDRTRGKDRGARCRTYSTNMAMLLHHLELLLRRNGQLFGVVESVVEAAFGLPVEKGAARWGKGGRHG